MAKRRKRKKVKLGGDFYMYPTGRYVREKLGSDKGCKDYRTVPVKGKPSRKVLVCIRKKKGPRGGKTKAVSLLRDINKVKKPKDKQARRAIKKAKKVVKKMNRKKKKS